MTEKKGKIQKNICPVETKHLKLGVSFKKSLQTWAFAQP